MYGLALCLPHTGQAQGQPVPHEIPKIRHFMTVVNNRLFLT